jgi:glutamate N-acetyltransferase / amino-acid N-acetyltransferase
LSGSGGHSSGGPDHPVVLDPSSSQFLTLPLGVQPAYPPDGHSGVTYPEGFLAAGVAASIKESGNRDVGVLAVADEYREKATGAAVFTRNAFAAAPVQLGRREVDLARLAAVVMNSGNANACTGRQGLEAARAMQHLTGERLGLSPERVGVASTGIIGHQLDMRLMAAGVGAACAALAPDGGRDFAESILTTDRFAKTAAFELATREGAVRLAGAAKGAGMIAPGMATMLCVVTTDAVLEPALARSLLEKEVEHSFNRVSVDGQMSTNDCVFLLASGASGIGLSGDGRGLFSAALKALLLRLALMMVADGEGATKVIRLRVTGAPSDEEARLAARAVADSPLVKTAMYGCDPNWGRILSAAGAALADRRLNDTALEIGGVRLVEQATPLALERADEDRLHTVMRSPEIDVLLDLRAGSGRETVYFSDMGHEYVTINAEYHT